MAFKRYAALLAGSALAGSALFAQPAMAEEAATEPAEFSYAPVTVEKGQQATSAKPAGADDCTRILPVSVDSDNTALVAALGATVDSNTGVVTFDQTELAPLPEAKEYTLKIACAIEAEGASPTWKTAPIEVTVAEKALTFGAATAKQGDTVELTRTSAPAEFENLKATTDGFEISIDADDTVKLTVDEGTAVGEKAVEFTYEAYGKKDLKGSVKVDVKKADEPVLPVVTIGDVTVTQGKTATVTANVEKGATELTLDAPEGIEATLGADGKTITVDATGAEVKTYTVPFTYKANGEEKNGSFKVTVEKKAEEPKENASSKASSNFLGSFKGLLSSK